MRDYGKVAPQFWIGATGKELKAAGPEAVIVGLYLMTSPHANMIGLYYLPVLYIAHETGLGLEGATRGLKACVEAGLCAYDEDDEVVFVPRMAAYQIAETLSVRDNRRIAVIREIESCGHTEFAELFLQAYAKPFNMDAPIYPSVPHHRFSKALTDRIVRACGGVCKGCGVSFDDEIPTIDHIVAKINGGGRDESNLQALCRQCNSRKSAKDREIFWSRVGIEATPYEGVPKGSHKDDRPLRSQEQEQEQEQKEDIAQQAARLPARFDEFWSEYPNKRGKAVAAKAWRRKRLDKIADRIIEDVKARKASDPRWQEGFIPDGSTYVNQERWEDAIDAPRLRAVPGSDYVPLPGEV